MCIRDRIHPYENISGVFYTKQTLYLVEKEGDGLLLPLAALGGMEGAEALMRVCDARCRDVYKRQPH